MVSLDDQVKAYVKKIMSQLNKWIQKSKISKLVIVITSKETGEHLERWQFDVSAVIQARLKHHADTSRSTSSTTRASQRKSPLPKARRTQHPRTVPTPLLLPPPLRSRNLRSSKKSSRFSVRSPLRSLSYRCSTATALSTCLCTPMPIVTCRSSGATVTRRRSRMPRKSC